MDGYITSAEREQKEVRCLIKKCGVQGISSANSSHSPPIVFNLAGAVNAANHVAKKLLDDDYSLAIYPGGTCKSTFLAVKLTFGVV